MSIVIDANMILFAERMNISSSRMVQEYGLKTVDEIIEAEAAQGNTQALSYAQEMYNSPDKLMQIFRLADVENKYILLHKMDTSTRQKLLPLLEKEDLVMGLYFFTQDKLLEMLQNVDIEELVNVVLEAFPFQMIIEMFPEDAMAQFFHEKDLDKYIIANELNSLPPEVMIKFIEGLTGQPYSKVEDPQGIIKNIIALPEDKFRDFVSQIDPDVQRQLVYQITKKDNKYMQLFKPEVYTDMLSTLIKPDMVKPMIALEKETIAEMISILPDDLMSIVAAQVDTKVFTEFLMNGHLDMLEDALMI